MSCCAKREIPDTSIDIDGLGTNCDVWAHLKDMFDYLKEERVGAVPCDTKRYSVQHSLVDAMTYLFIITDHLTGETLEYTVVKEFTKEGPQEAFERDYRERELRYNRSIVRALEDHLEALQEVHPDDGYTLRRNKDGYRIFRPIKQDLGVVVFRVDYEVEDGPVVMPRITSTTEFPDVPGELGRSIELLIKRFGKLGVVFEEAVVDEKINDYREVSLTGRTFRSPWNHMKITISYQEIALDDDKLRRYHEYYTI